MDNNYYESEYIQLSNLMDIIRKLLCLQKRKCKGIEKNKIDSRKWWEKKRCEWMKLENKWNQIKEKIFIYFLGGRSMKLLLLWQSYLSCVLFISYNVVVQYIISIFMILNFLLWYKLMFDIIYCIYSMIYWPFFSPPMYIYTFLLINHHVYFSFSFTPPHFLPCFLLF